MHTIAIAADHAGYRLKEHLRGYLEDRHHVIDLGTHSGESVDYPDFGRAAAECVLRGEADTAIVICGSGIGVSIAANRYPGIRAALCHTPEAARLAREHNDANILALGARAIDEQTANAVVEAFLTTPFAEGRHRPRVEKLG